MKQDDMQQKIKTTVQSHDTALNWSNDQYGGSSKIQERWTTSRHLTSNEIKRLVARAKSKIDPMVPGTLLSASGNIVTEVPGTCSFENRMRWQNPSD